MKTQIILLYILLHQMIIIIICFPRIIKVNSLNMLFIYLFKHCECILFNLTLYTLCSVLHLEPIGTDQSLCKILMG